jgi:CO/xanthine dehydrogenase Mo-binding subunit
LKSGCGVQDIGTGTRTVIAVVAAEMLGLKPEQITVRVG